MNLFGYAAEAALVGVGYLVLGAVTRALWEWIER